MIVRFCLEIDAHVKQAPVAADVRRANDTIRAGAKERSARTLTRPAKIRSGIREGL